MFKKILVANRGEIACRIIRSAKAMGIYTVAVYSDADEQALHVQEADEAVYIGISPAAESYLMIEKMMKAIHKTGAEAVHPGYGFLSENKEFSRILKEEGIVFIGPPVGAIESMGDKITSKKLAAQSGVSVVPGYMGFIEDEQEAIKISKKIGYPVMIKASAGGGGKGMRVAWNDTQVVEGYHSSKHEAMASFGDDRIFIEKFITQPRHIEIQILGDKHGNIIHLGERECSIQRRNQKVIEEAPSVFLDEETRKKMGKEAVILAKAVNYCSAGTVEFIVDGDRNFYFLEMNTRLQVEHPVTELITGIDLVEEMIRIAYGEKIRIKQKDVKRNGWAIESRIYAEDPYREFLPSIGRLVRYCPPLEKRHCGTTIRNDTGVIEGSEISIYYDPLIAKLITHAATRDKAIDSMRHALDEFRIDGIRHNIDFLSAIMGHSRFHKGALTTAFIEEEYPDGFHGTVLDESRIRILAVIGVFLRYQMLLRFTEETREDYYHLYDLPDTLFVQIGDRVFEAKRTERGVLLDDTEMRIKSDWLSKDMFFKGMIDGEQVIVIVHQMIEGFILTGHGCATEVYVRSKMAQDLMQYMPKKIDGTGDKELICPMPGVVVSIAVSEGESIKIGGTLAVVEAMKMENILRAEKDVTVKKIFVSAGDKLSVDDVMIEFE